MLEVNKIAQKVCAKKKHKNAEILKIDSIISTVLDFPLRSEMLAMTGLVIVRTHGPNANNSPIWIESRPLFSSHRGQKGIKIPAVRKKPP